MTETAAQAPARNRAVWWVVGIVGCGLGVALAVWIGLADTVGQVTWNDVGYEVVDDRTVTVSFDVHRPAGTPVTCTVRALDKRFGTVGTVEVAIPAGPGTAVNRTVEIRTTTRAVTGTVKLCEAT